MSHQVQISKFNQFYYVGHLSNFIVQYLNMLLKRPLYQINLVKFCIRLRKLYEIGEPTKRSILPDLDLTTYLKMLQTCV